MHPTDPNGPTGSVAPSALLQGLDGFLVAVAAAEDGAVVPAVLGALEDTLEDCSAPTLAQALAHPGSAPATSPIASPTELWLRVAG